MTIPGLIWIDRVGRRPILLLGSTLMATWLFANAGILAVYGTDPGRNGVGGIKEASVQVSGAASKAVIACSYLVSSSFLPTYLTFSISISIPILFLLFFTFTPHKPTELTHNPSSSSPPTHPPGVPSPGSILPNYIPTISAAKPSHSPPLVRFPSPPPPPQKSSSPHKPNNLPN